MKNTRCHYDLQALECLHCHKWLELRQGDFSNPENLMMARESFDAIHAACHARVRIAPDAKPEKAVRQNQHDLNVQIAIYVLGGM